MTTDPDQRIIRVSTRFDVIGKQNFNFSRGWSPSELPLDALVKHICKGYPFAVGHYNNNYRKAANFVQSNLAALDIDGNGAGNPLTDDDLKTFLAHPLITQHAAAVIPSASSQPNAWKLRVLFILDEPVTDAKTYSHVVTELMSRSPYSDPACKDAARFFYGSPNGTALLVNESASISTHDLLEAALVKLPKKKQKTIQRHTKSQVHYSGDNNRDDLISALNAIPVDGHPYHDWISILAACKACNLEQEAIAWGGVYGEEIARVLPGLHGNNHSAGTIYKFAQDAGWIRDFTAPSGDDLVPGWKKQETLPDDTIKMNTPFFAAALPSSTKAVVVKSGLGTGKTTWAAAEALKHQRVLVIVPHRSLAKDVYEKHYTADRGFSLYTDVKAKDYHYQRSMVICLNSLHKLTDRGGRLPSYDLIIFDESDLNLERLIDDTFKGNEAVICLGVLLQLIRQSGLILCLDATLTQLTLDFLKMAGRDNPHIIHNTWQPQNRRANIYNRQTRVLKELQDALAADNRDGKTKILVVDERAAVKKYEKMFSQKGYTVRAIHGGNSRDLEQEIIDINTHLASGEWDLLIYNQALGSGVDIQYQADEIFCIFAGKTSGPQGLIQMLGRVRNTSTYHIYMGKREAFLPETYSEWHQYILQKRRWVSYEVSQRFPKLRFATGEFDAEGNPQYTSLQWSMIELFCRIKAKQSAYTNLIYKVFVSLLRDNLQMEVSFIFDKDDDPTIKRDRKDAAAAARQETVQAILDSDPIDPKTLDFVPSEDQKPGIKKHNIATTLNIPAEAITEKAIKTYNGIHKQAPFWFRMVTMGTPKDLHDADIHQHRDDVAIHQRDDFALKLHVIQKLLAIIFPEGFHTNRLDPETFDDLLSTFQKQWDLLQADYILRTTPPTRRDTHKKTGYVMGMPIWEAKTTHEIALKNLRYMLNLLGLRLDTKRQRSGKSQYELNAERLAMMNRICKDTVEDDPALVHTVKNKALQILHDLEVLYVRSVTRQGRNPITP